MWVHTLLPHVFDTLYRFTQTTSHRHKRSISINVCHSRWDEKELPTNTDTCAVSVAVLICTRASLRWEVKVTGSTQAYGNFISVLGWWGDLTSNLSQSCKHWQSWLKCTRRPLSDIERWWIYSNQPHTRHLYDLTSLNHFVWWYTRMTWICGQEEVTQKLTIL